MHTAYSLHLSWEMSEASYYSPAFMKIALWSWNGLQKENESIHTIDWHTLKDRIDLDMTSAMQDQGKGIYYKNDSSAILS